MLAKEIFIEQAPERVTVTLPAEVRPLFLWLKKYDPQFDGKDAQIAAFLIRKGAEAYYQNGLENVEPLESEVFDSLNEKIKTAFSAAIDEDPAPPTPRKSARR